MCGPDASFHRSDNFCGDSFILRRLGRKHSQTHLSVLNRRHATHKFHWNRPCDLFAHAASGKVQKVHQQEIHKIVFRQFTSGMSSDTTPLVFLTRLRRLQGSDGPRCLRANLFHLTGSQYHLVNSHNPRF
jgi:hypothetical protein